MKNKKRPVNLSNDDKIIIEANGGTF